MGSLKLPIVTQLTASLDWWIQGCRQIQLREAETYQFIHEGYQSVKVVFCSQREFILPRIVDCTLWRE